MPSAILDQLDTFGPDRCDQLDYQQATDYTRELTQAHAENFSVVSWLLPKRLRDDFRHVYAFCRWADDLGDETGDPARSLELLAWWRDELDQCYAGQPRHPVFVALRHTIEKHDIPRAPFDHLIDAFVQDQTVTRYDTWDQVLDYCTRSADPVGRLVLHLCDYHDDTRQRLSDQTCTALQLINFWQDVRRDILERDRVYIPQDIARKHDLDIELMVKIVKLDGQVGSDDASGASCCDGSQLPSAGMAAIRPAYVNTVRELVERTKPMFTAGRALWPMLSPDVRPDIQLFTYGGQATVRLVEKQKYDTLTHRPSLGKPAKLALVMRALLGKLRSGRRGHAGAGGQS